MLGLTEFILIAAVAVFFLVQYSKSRNLPPGPRGYPIVGNVFDLMKYPHLKMSEWAQEYGKIYKIQMGTNTGVVLNDHKLIKEVMFDTNFTGKPDIPMFDMFSGGKHGVLSTAGSVWEEQRRWVLRKLRDHGFGKTSMEGMIMDEVHEVVDYFKKNQDTPLNISDRFNIAAMNSLWTIMTGHRLSQDDPKLRAIHHGFESIIPVLGQSGLAFAPWLRHVKPKAYKQVKDVADQVMTFVRDAVTHHFDTRKEGSVQNRDFIDEYIEEIEKTDNESSSFFKSAGRKNLEAVVSDLLQAGSETTSTTIQWTILYLLQYPEVKKKLQQELDSVIGTRQVSLDDKPNLPYTEAVILETLRFSSISASGVQHAALEDSKLLGYNIPKGTWIFANLYHVHHDAAIWGDPENFRPERFLSADGKKAVRPETLIPFQIGRRVCLGETLAKDSLFLFTSTIFQKFNITTPETTKPTVENGLFLIPSPYKCVFKYRETD